MPSCFHCPTVCLSGTFFGSVIFPFKQFAELTPINVLHAAAVWFSSAHGHEFSQLSILQMALIYTLVTFLHWF